MQTLEKLAALGLPARPAERSSAAHLQSPTGSIRALRPPRYGDKRRPGGPRYRELRRPGDFPAPYRRVFNRAHAPKARWVGQPSLPYRDLHVIRNGSYETVYLASATQSTYLPRAGRQQDHGRDEQDVRDRCAQDEARHLHSERAGMGRPVEQQPGQPQPGKQQQRNRDPIPP